MVCNCGPGRLIEAEEPPDAVPVQAVPLRSVYFPALPGGAVHDGLGNQQAVDDMAIQDLVGVEVVALADAQGRAFLGDEVEAGVDLVLAVGEEELHR